MRSGDKVRVIRNNVNAHKPDDPKKHLEPGDIITIKHYIDNRDDAHKYHANYGFGMYGNCILYEVNSSYADLNFIPAMDVELVSDTSVGSVFSPVEDRDKEWLKTHQCTCDMVTLMRTGCKCFPEF